MTTFKYLSIAVFLLGIIACNPPDFQISQSDNNIAPNTPQTDNSQTPHQNNQPTPQTDNSQTPQNDNTTTNLPANNSQNLPNDNSQTDNSQTDNSQTDNPQTNNPQADNPPNHQNDTLQSNLFNYNTPLTEKQRIAIAQLQHDDPPEELNAIKEEHKNKHFLTSDELHPELFKNPLSNLNAGVYIGVGTDQAYLFISWLRPILAFPVDYDPWVYMLNQIYLTFFIHCENIDHFLKAFSDKEHGLAILQEAYKDKPNLKEIILIYNSSQKNVSRRLYHIKNTMRKLNIPTPFNDDESYNFLRTLALNHRLIPMQANLLGDKAFQAIANFCNELNINISALYLSNAEQYWGYSTQFKQNMKSLPYNDDAIIMRTAATKPQNADYRYSVQPAKIFLQWLESPLGTNVRKITKPIYVKNADHFPFSVDDQLPPQNTEINP